MKIKKNATLSAQQLVILQLLANGMEGKQIARQLYLTVSTVSTHVRRAGHVLGSRNRTHTVAVALRRGLIV